jgi:hypothetical protein
VRTSFDCRATYTHVARITDSSARDRDRARETNVNEKSFSEKGLTRSRAILTF